MGKCYSRNDFPRDCLARLLQYLADVSDIFYFFFGLGEGKGEHGATGGVGESVFIANHRGGVLPEGRGGAGSREGLRGIWWGGGGLNIFFSGPKFPPRIVREEKTTQT